MTKRTHKILSFLLSLCLLTSMAVLPTTATAAQTSKSSSAAEQYANKNGFEFIEGKLQQQIKFTKQAVTEPNKVYFQEPDNWSGERVYCHICQYDGDKTAFYGWQLKAEKCEYEGDGRWSYDLSILDKSTQIKGGLGNDIYLLMFSDNTYNETCPIMFHKNVIGDTYKIVDTTEQTFESPEDSAKTQWKGSWTKNAKKYGVPLMITSVGTIQGEFITKGSDPEDLIKDWDKKKSAYPNDQSYSKQSSARDHATRLAEIKKELKSMINSGKILYVGGGVYSPTTAKKTTVKLAKTSADLYVKQTVKISATVKNGSGKTTYKNNNKKVATVNAKGVVTAVKKGTAKITVTNNGVKKIFTVKVKNPKLNKTKLTLKKGKTFTLKITGKVGKAKFSTNKKSVATVNKNGKITAKKKGSAVITVKTNGITLKVKVKVN